MADLKFLKGNHSSCLGLICSKTIPDLKTSPSHKLWEKHSRNTERKLIRVSKSVARFLDGMGSAHIYY